MTEDDPADEEDVAGGGIGMSDGSEGVPGELQAGFWKTVVVLNAAGIGLALGAMLWVFERSRWALPVFGGGVAAAVHAWVLYRRYAPRHRDEPYE